MGKKDRFTSVCDAIEDDPVRQGNPKLRSALMIDIAELIKEAGLTQKQAADILHSTRPQVSALLIGKLNSFRLDSQVDMAHWLDMHVSINVAASLRDGDMVRTGALAPVARTLCGSCSSERGNSVWSGPSYWPRARAIARSRPVG